MGECIISRGASAGSSSNANIANNGLVTEIFLTSTMWKVPENIRNNSVSVTIFGGGGAGGTSTGGSSGFMNNAIIDVSGETLIPITIGSGGDSNSAPGGTTSFGTYLSALGGSMSIGGGSLGGCGNGCARSKILCAQYGGGGGMGARVWYTGSSGLYGLLSHGGKFGGGGGYCASSPSNNISYGGCIENNISDISGYGGNGGCIINNNIYNAENGINTIGMGLEFEGFGLAGSSTDSYIANGAIIFGGGGGGGYGGNGGNGKIDKVYNNESGNKYAIIAAGGGGGGYGSNGGDGYASGYNSNGTVLFYMGGGGGGGYGGDGGSASSNIGGGGGGYGKYGQGGGYHNINGTRTLMPAGIAAGGFGVAASNNIYGYGGSGICIIQYYI